VDSTFELTDGVLLAYTLTQMSQKEVSVKEELAKTLDSAEWAWLKPHLERDALILVSSSLDLLQIAVEVAENQRVKIQDYLNAGSLSKPTSVQIESWNQISDKKFQVIIVRPFVLIQEALGLRNDVKNPD
jgi:hypothetical protein